MAIELLGVERLLKKLDKVSDLDYRQAVDDVLPLVEKSLMDACPVDSGESKKHLTLVEVHDRPGHYSVEFGFSSMKYPFGKWKAAYYQNFGYHNRGWGNRFGGRLVMKHYHWFYKAVDGIKGQAERKLKERVRRVVREAIGN